MKIGLFLQLTSPIPEPVRVNQFLVCLAVLCLLAGCQSNEASEYAIDSNGSRLKVFIKKAGAVNYLQCQDGDTILSSWPLRYPVFRFLKGDVNNDGRDDLAVGVIKPTRGDPVARKRLFLFQVRNKAIIPLWLGSSLGHPLEDFRVRVKKDSSTVIRALEKERSGLYLVAEYEWLGFGLSFKEYLKREISLSEAYKLLEE
jgi:hypothetical protein